jgi:hypothetical protein
MSRGSRSGAVLAAAVGLLALAPAPAAAAGAQYPSGTDAAGVASSTTAKSLAGIVTSGRRLAPLGPTHRSEDVAGVATAKASPREFASLPTGVGNNVDLSAQFPTNAFSTTAVAVDPNITTGNHITAVSNFLDSNTDVMTYSTDDNGATWARAPFELGSVSAVSGGEPGVAFDNFGTTGGSHTFFAFLDFDKNLDSALQVTRLNSAGGWTITFVENFGNQPGRPMIATDPRFGNGGVYVAYDNNLPGATTGEPIMVASSHDDGQTYGTPVQVWNSGGEFGAWPAVGGDGTVYVVWDDVCGANPSTVPTLTACPKLQGQILLSKSTDGGSTWSSTPIHVADTTTGDGSILPNYATECTQGCAARPVSASPQIAIDRSGGARNGTIYVAYADGADRQLGASTVPSSHRMHVFLTESRDNGATWSTPLRIDTGNPNDAWEPSVAVDQSNGNVVVSWYDRRDDGSNHLYVPYFAESLSDSNGAAQFSPQLRVGDVASDPQRDCNGSGDYQQIAAGNGTAHPVWTDTRNPLPAIYSSAIDEATAATSTATAGTGSSGLRPADGTGWQGLPGGATDIGVAADCQAWIIGENAIAGGGETWFWAGPSGGWQPFVGGGVRISVYAFGLPRVVNNTGAIYALLSNGTWLNVPGGGRDIGSGADLSLWLIGLDPEPGGHGVWRFFNGGWNYAGGAGERIAVGPDGMPWIVNNAGQIWHLTPGGWAQVPGGARDIGVGADGSVWIIGLNPIAGGWQTYRFNGSGWDAVNGGGVAISVGPDGMPWVVNSAGQIYERV